MRKMQNTLYVTTPDAYLSLDGENVVVLKGDAPLGRVPLHNIESIITFGYTGASPALMGTCADRNISLCFMTRTGRFLARVVGGSKGNVVLRKEQYAISSDEEKSGDIAKNFIVGKIFNSKWVLERATRDHALRLNVNRLKSASEQLSTYLEIIRGKADIPCRDLETLRGYEGKAATVYFSVIDELILQQKESFYFRERNKRPPLDNVNALLSFCYTLLANDVASALEAVGLDAYVGFLHRDRPGRASLALDLMEELRSVLVDRFVISLINTRQISDKDFIQKENGATIFTDEGRRIVLNAWQSRKQEKITHPFIEEKIPWGLVPHAQAILLARFIRGDLEEYPPFLWK